MQNTYVQKNDGEIDTWIKSCILLTSQSDFALQKWNAISRETRYYNTRPPVAISYKLFYLTIWKEVG